MPDSAVEVPGDASFGEVLTRTREMQSYRVGSETVFLMGSQGLLANVNLSVKTDTLTQADKLQNVLSAGVVLVRTTPRIRIPPLLYVAIGPVPEVDTAGADAVQYGGQRLDWPLTGNEMTRTNIGVALPPVSWQTYMDAFPTWQDMADAYPTWLDAKKNPPGA